MLSNSFVKRFRKLDAYAKTLDDFRVRTATGGTGKYLYSMLSSFDTNQTTVVTLVSAVTILLLVLFEVIRYMTPVMQSEIIVDGGIMVRYRERWAWCV